ncbi:unnamed protein product, partial [Mesorhabditis spiculigera]
MVLVGAINRSLPFAQWLGYPIKETGIGEWSNDIHKIAGCKLDSVYDLREDHDEDAETSDLYDDDRAFRRPRSNSSDFLILRKTSRPLSVDVVGLVDTMHVPYRQYMKVVDCYELAPHKNEVIIVDTQLSVIKAFEAMCDSQVGAILVWDREKGALTSIVTLSDFLHHVQRADAVGAMDSPVATILSGNQLVALNSDTKEFTANKVHRLIIGDPQTGDVHYLLTIKRALQAIHRQVSMDDDLSKAVEMLLGFRVSSLPVVDKDGVAVDVLHKADIAMSIYGQEDPKSFISGSTVKDILPPRPQPFFAQETTRVSECLDNMLNCRHTRRLFIVNERGEPTACVSLSDFLTHMLYSGKPFEFEAQRYTWLSKMYSYNTLKVDKGAGFVVLIQLNRANRLNAMNFELWREIDDCFEKLAVDVVFGGNGKAFSVGLDLKDNDIITDLGDDSGSDQARRSFLLGRKIRFIQKCFTNINECPKPVIVATHGYCLGAGVDLITACDIRLASKETQFSIKEVDVGIVADVGTLNRIGKVCGNDSWLRDLAFTGRNFGAEEAQRNLLMSGVYGSREETLEQALKLAKTIAEKSPVAVQGTKINLNYSREHTTADSLEYVATWNQSQLFTDDVAKSAMAILTKSKVPVFEIVNSLFMVEYMH